MKNNKKLKIILIIVSILVTIFLVLGFITVKFLYSNFTQEGNMKKVEKVINEHLSNNYGEELKVNIVHFQGTHSGNMGNVWHTVVLEDNPNIKFDVHIEGFIGAKTVLEDEYDYGLLSYEKFKKLEGHIDTIERLGFSKQEELDDDNNGKVITRNYIEYENDKENILYNLVVSYEGLDKEDILSDKFIDDLYNLVVLINDNNVELDDINISSDFLDYFYIDVKDISNIGSKEDLIFNLKNNNEDILSYLEMSNYENDFRSLENERFVFKGEYNENWLECEEVSEGECYKYNIDILYKDSDLSHLEEDLNLMLYGIDGILNNKDVEIESENYWKKYFRIDLINEDGVNYSLDNEGYIDEHYKINIEEALEDLKKYW